MNERPSILDGLDPEGRVRESLLETLGIGRTELLLAALGTCTDHLPDGLVTEPVDRRCN